ncbi:11567_t:CDS:2, partial [Racocetra fulgida]
MVKAIKSIRDSVNLIWKATYRKVVGITFDSSLRLATISLSDGYNATLKLDAPEKLIINEFAGYSGKESVIIENSNQDSDESFSQFDKNAYVRRIMANYLLIIVLTKKISKTQQENLGGSDDSRDKSSSPEANLGGSDDSYDKSSSQSDKNVSPGAY